MTTSWAAIGAANNAEWCGLVCRTHGIASESDQQAWTSPTRSPPLYPDAVTLAPDISIPALLARVDSSPGCSIKDSFASLDLAPHGFRVLFEAEWVVRAPAQPIAKAVRRRWTVVHDVITFAAWESAWRIQNGPTDVLRPELLGEEAVRVLEARDGDRISGGAILNRSAAVIGISNFFSDGNDTAERWEGFLALAGALFPGATLMGYESGDTLGVLQRHGFEAAGPLRVWLREG